MQSWSSSLRARSNMTITSPCSSFLNCTAALSEGLEWTTKISHYELPYLWSKVAGTFETYWLDDEFQTFTQESSSQLKQAIERERNQTSDAGAIFSFDLHPYPFQQEILDALAAERDLQGKHAHLVVAATGTGK